MKKSCYNIRDFVYQILGAKKTSYYNPKNYYREKFINKYRNGKFYFNLMDRVEKMEEMKTIVPISFIENIKLNEVSVKDVIKEYGSSNYKIISEGLSGVEILFYKLKLGEYKMKIEFHFFNAKLFFYSCTFSMSNVINKSEILKIIKDKYSVEGLFGNGNNYIIDEYNNIILSNNNIDFSLYYLCNTEMIKDIIGDKVGTRKNKKNKEILYSKL